VVTSDVLKPCAAPQSPCVPPTCGCPLLREHLRGPWCLCDRLLRGDEFTAANVADGSKGMVRGVQERSLARQPRWLFKAQPVARQGSVSFKVKLTFAANDGQSQVWAAADIRYSGMNDRNQSQAARAAAGRHVDLQQDCHRVDQVGPTSSVTCAQIACQSPPAASTISISATTVNPSSPSPTRSSIVLNSGLSESGCSLMRSWRHPPSSSGTFSLAYSLTV